MKSLDRRRLLLRALAMGVISPLAGCNYEDPQHPDLADDFLHTMSYWNDRVQQALFNPHTLAPTFRPDADHQSAALQCVLRYFAGDRWSILRVISSSWAGRSAIRRPGRWRR